MLSEILTVVVGLELLILNGESEGKRISNDKKHFSEEQREQAAQFSEFSHDVKQAIRNEIKKDK